MHHERRGDHGGTGGLIIKNAYSGVSPAGQYLWDLTIDARAAQKWWRFYNDSATRLPSRSDSRTW